MAIKTPHDNLDRWRKGEKLDHRKLNEPVDAINRMRPGIPGPRQVRGQGRRIKAGQLFAIALNQTDGDAGDNDDICTFEYTVTDAISGEDLDTGVNPDQSPHKWVRTATGKYVAADHGHAYRKMDNTLVITWINEVAAVLECP